MKQEHKKQKKDEAGCGPDCCKEERTPKEGTEKEKELVETCQRLQAEFENFKKRTDKEKEEYRITALAIFIEDLLPIIDNMELALAHPSSDKHFYAGMELIFVQLKEYLVKQGVEEIKPEKEKFDPTKHEAMMTAESELSPNTIIEVLQKGYMLNGKVIRTAKVKVAK